MSAVAQISTAYTGVCAMPAASAELATPLPTLALLRKYGPHRLAPRRLALPLPPVRTALSRYRARDGFRKKTVTGILGELVLWGARQSF